MAPQTGDRTPIHPPSHSRGSKLGGVAAWLALASAKGVGPKTFARLVECFGSPAAVLDAGRGELLRCGLLSAPVVAAVVEGRNRLAACKALAAQLASSGVAATPFTHPLYPRRLHALADPPPLLFSRGDPPPARTRSVAIVGTTQPSRRGAGIARELAARLAGAGCTIVSGYARGIDTAAHLGALLAHGRTTLVLPTGILAFRWRPPFQRISGIEQHAHVVSERPPHDGWTTGNAIARNRLIVALSDAVVFVETLARPAARDAFGLARRLGRPVFVVKYRRAPASAKGNAALLRMGGAPVTRYADVRVILGAQPSAASRQVGFDW